MSTHAANTGLSPSLRLVGTDDVRESVPASRRREAARENLLASTLQPEDVRAVFAAHVSRALDGGRAAILRPERRRELVAVGVKLGLREFDTNLLIAIVQDAAREGTPWRAADVQARLACVSPARPDARAGLLAAAALAAGALIFVGLLTWLFGRA